MATYLEGVFLKWIIEPPGSFLNSPCLEKNDPPDIDLQALGKDNEVTLISPVFYRNLIENGWVGMVPSFNCHHFALFSILLLSFRVWGLVLMGVGPGPGPGPLLNPPQK